MIEIDSHECNVLKKLYNLYVRRIDLNYKILK